MPPPDIIPISLIRSSPGQTPVRMANTLTVAYINEPEVDFDERYYTSHHMPLCHDAWQQYGLETWSVTRYHPGPDGSEPQYRYSCDLVFKDEESMHQALASPDTASIVQDVANFTRLKGIFLFGKKIVA